MKTQTQSEQDMSSSDTERNTKEKEQCKKKKYFNPQKEDHIPSGVANSVTREKLSMAKGKPQKIGMTAKINSIPTCSI